MFIKLNENGDLSFTGGKINFSENERDKKIQNAIAETRCVKGTFFLDEKYGLDPLIFYMPTSSSDKKNDLKRVCEKYLPVKSIKENSGIFTLEF